MNDDELIGQLSAAIIDPIRDLLDRTLTLLERLTDRVETLELDALHRRAAPDDSPERRPRDPGVTLT